MKESLKLQGSRSHRRNVAGGIPSKLRIWSYGLWGGHSLAMSQVQRGKSNARGDNPKLKSRKTQRRQEKKKRKEGKELPLLQVDSILIQKSESQTSLLSVRNAGSYKSAVSATSTIGAFSKQTEAEADDDKRR